MLSADCSDYSKLNPARDSLAKGGLKRDDQAQVLLGMALYNLGRYDEAISAFRLASKDTRSRRTSNQWTNHIGSEQVREAGLRQALGEG
jgi:Tfp pilus assembly protein PilF